MRLFQSMLGAVLSWTAMLTHHGLFSPAMMIIGQAIVGISFLLTSQRRKLLGGLLDIESKSTLSDGEVRSGPFNGELLSAGCAATSSSRYSRLYSLLFRGRLQQDKWGCRLPSAPELVPSP